MKRIFALTAAALFASSNAFAADVEKGEKEFKKCKACHTIASADEVIFKGGKTGPNLYGIVGRTAGADPEFSKYGDDLVALGETGLTWTEDLLVEYVRDPKGFLSAQLDTAARSKMSFKLKDASNIVAYLAAVGPQQEASAADDTVGSDAE
ncbi:cytochrome c [Pacificibacter maritimus]|uniref:Cytochrome c n=1 Tax=Pacificibacter maritimus TaxID=762213 RepID=A0A3N4VDF0_9RHOB|nr:cytochrome C [Pacificibacter maritimus]RPE71890.1 cytochrome c [Pacificibacter maritimus]